MDIEYGMSVKDKDGKVLGTIDHIIMDSWSGEPRKFVVRLDDDISAVYFRPKDVSGTGKDGVKLNVDAGELEQT